MAASTDAQITVFYSYSHKDEKFLAKLRSHLSLLRNEGLIQDWHDRKITAGTEWAKSIDDHLNTDQIILLLISADFLSSHYCYGIEMKRALERHDAREARVIPIILRPCDWHSALFGKLQALPTDAKPIAGSAWRNQDEAWADVAVGMRRVINEMKKPSVPDEESTGMAADSDNSKLRGNDAKVFRIIYDQLRESGDLESFIDSAELVKAAHSQGINEAETKDAVEMLVYLGQVRTLGQLGPSYDVTYTVEGFINYGHAIDAEFQETYNRIEQYVAAVEHTDNHTIATTLNISKFSVNGCLYRMRDLGDIQLEEYSGPTLEVAEVSIKLRRKYREP